VSDMSTMKLEDYLELPYTIEVLKDEGDNYSGWFARVVELPGCMTQADTFAELSEMIQEAMAVWIETALEDGETIPLPRSVDDFSGRFVIRIPKSLHKELVEMAEREGVSLNTYVNVALGKMVGQARKSQSKKLGLAA
jgi:antitoxin HicB